ncbi:MAG: hypothetical protein HOK27_01030 [Rhodobacteraceae bacterium]|nr:hypothetical protein [Paracoccaceae bacterium]
MRISFLIPQVAPIATMAIKNEVPAAYKPLLINTCEVAFEMSGTVTYML